MDKEILNCSLNDNLTFNSRQNSYSGDGLTSAGDNIVLNTSCWQMWTDWYYPQVIRESYPVYIQEKAKDKGKQAFEIIKVLKDKRLINLEKVSDFIDVMDELIKIL